MNDAPNFATIIEQERARLNQQRAEVLDQRAALDAQLAGIDQELIAITAYEQAKQGKLTIPGAAGAVPGKRRSGIRADVLAIIARHPRGIARREILVAMNAKGDKQAEQSISNALSALKRQNAITADDGQYTVATG